MRLTAVLACLLLSGCLDLAPKAGKLADVSVAPNATKLAEVDAKITGLEAKVGKLTGIEATVDTKIDAKGNELTAKMLDLQSNVSQQIGSVKGQVNTGMFSGGAVYVTVVCVTLILCLAVLVAYLFYLGRRWKGAFSALKDTIHEEQSESYRALKGNLDAKLRSRGFGGLLKDS